MGRFRYESLESNHDSKGRNLITEAQIRLALWEFFSTNVKVGGNDLVVIHEDQAASRPNMPYGTIRFLTSQSLGGSDETRKTDNTGMTDQTRYRTISVSFKVIGYEAFDLINQLNNAFNNPVLTQNLWWTNELATQVKGQIQNVTFIRDTEIETQYVMDVLFGYAYNDDIETGFIESVEITECVTEQEFSQIIE